MKQNSISKIIQNITDLDWRSIVYMDSKEEILDKKSLLVIAKSDKEEIEEGAVEFNNKKYFYLMSVQILQDIIENADQQKNDANMEDYISAVNFYIENDAYINF